MRLIDLLYILRTNPFINVDPYSRTSSPHINFVEAQKAPVQRIEVYVYAPEMVDVRHYAKTLSDYIENIASLHGHMSMAFGDAGYSYEVQMYKITMTILYEAVERPLPEGNREAQKTPEQTNVCLTEVGVSGSTIGYHVGLGIGEADPNETRDETLFYGYYWDYPATVGKFYIKFGDAGTTQLSDVDSILIVSSDGTEAGIAVWDDTDMAYTFTNLDLAQRLNAEYDKNGLAPSCFNMFILPSKFIDYDLAEILTGVAE